MCGVVSVFQFKGKIGILDGSQMHDSCRSIILTGTKELTESFENMWINDSVLIQASFLYYM
jgi:hypothetical protein